MDHDVAHSIYKHDPDGNLVEIYADVVKDWEAVRHGVIIKGKPQWIPGVSNPPSTERNYPRDPEIRIVNDAIFHPRKITHAALAAKDYEAMVRYYTGIVGLAPVVGGESSPFALLRGTVGTCDVALYRHRPGPGLHHVGFEVWDEADLERSVAAISSRGIKVERDVDHPPAQRMHQGSGRAAPAFLCRAQMGARDPGDPRRGIGALSAVGRMRDRPHRRCDASARAGRFARQRDLGSVST